MNNQPIERAGNRSRWRRLGEVRTKKFPDLRAKLAGLSLAEKRAAVQQEIADAERALHPGDYSPYQWKVALHSFYLLGRYHCLLTVAIRTVEENVAFPIGKLISNEEDVCISSQGNSES